MTMTTNTIPDHLPPDPATRSALVALAMFFDERHADRTKLAEQMRADEDPSYPEQQAIANTMQNAANVAWEMLGGRPDGSFAHREHFVKISARELAKLIELATRSSQSQQVPNTASADVQFDEGLVERLAVVFGDCRLRGVSVNDTMRAILSELAATPCELPTVQQVIDAWTGRHIPTNDATRDHFDVCAKRLLNRLHSHLNPILVAKDAKAAGVVHMWGKSMDVVEQRPTFEHLVERLACRLDPQDPPSAVNIARVAVEFIVADFVKSFEVTIPEDFVQAWKGLPNFANDRDRAIAAHEVVQRRVAPLFVAKNAELARLREGERVAADWIAERDSCRARIVELASRAPANEVQSAERAQYDAIVEQQRKRIAELEQYVTDGMEVRAWLKTRIAELEKCLATESSEALRKVRERIANATPDGRFDVSSGEFPALLVDNVVGIINDEIANVGSAVHRASPIATSSPTTSPRIFLGVSFERELPNGKREKVDPSRVRLVIEGDNTQFVPVGFGGGSS
jgi:hypothetical protein